LHVVHCALPWGATMHSPSIGCVESAHKQRVWLSGGSLAHDVFGNGLQSLSLRQSTSWNASMKKKKTGWCVQNVFQSIIYTLKYFEFFEQRFDKNTVFYTGRLNVMVSWFLNFKATHRTTYMCACVCVIRKQTENCRVFFLFSAL